jgi:hypothetical protein
MEEDHGTGTYARETREARKMGTARVKVRFSSKNTRGRKEPGGGKNGKAEEEPPRTE